MAFDDLALLSRRDRIRLGVLIAILIAVSVWASSHFLRAGPPRRIVMASGPESGVYHQHARRYVEILDSEGVVVEERITTGAEENLRLLADPRSGVDVALLQAGIAKPQSAGHVVMLATLYYEPLWIFYRGSATLARLADLKGMRIAVGIAGSGTRALVQELLRVNEMVDKDGVTRGNTEVVAIGGDAALAALQAGEIDAALFVGGARAPAIQAALRDPRIKLMSLVDAAAYARQFPFIAALALPTGAIDIALNVPGGNVAMIGTTAMLAARDDLHPALINLLMDAARDIHGGQSTFENAGEFPGTTLVDLPVSPYADEHRRFGRSFLYRYLPFWLATFVERAFIVLVPLVVIVVPLASYLPGVLRWRARSRIFRWYGELALLERDVVTRRGELPIERWLQDLARIQAAVENLRTPTMFASEAYTLREHIGLVRRAVLEKRPPS